MRSREVPPLRRQYRYGSSSLKHIGTVMSPLQTVCHKAIQIANTRKMHCPDFGISRGFSTPDEQFELFKQGRIKTQSGWIVNDPGKIITNCDGTGIKSPHQSGRAVDFFAYVDGRANYEDGNIALIATCFMEAADNMCLEYDWGGNFRSISDGAHFELVMP